MSDAMTSILLASLAAAFTIAGGSLPLVRKQLGERGISLLVAFSAGVLLSAGINDKLPESFDLAHEGAVLGVFAGFMLLYLIEKVTMVHACREQGCKVHPFGFFALVGIGFHTMLDGFSIAVSGEARAALGLVVAFAVLAHSFPSGVSVASVMLSCGYKRSKAWWVLILLAVQAIIGAVIGLFFSGASDQVLGFAIGLSAGTFLYISTSDLLPIAHETNWKDYRVPMFFTAGFGLMLATALALG
ncbi:MAG: ZIP family metal transporter [Thermoleophilia bacterium]|nr:ZIP family metal transporter [Thermoleophilia bacterium]